jgi:hypothetical protein
MSETTGIEKRYRLALASGVVVVVMLQAALFAWGGSGDTDAERPARPTAQLVNLPENQAPLADVAEALTPQPGEEAAPQRADVDELAAIPEVPKLAAAAATQPLTFMEEVQEPEAKENPAVTYASVSDFLVTSSPNPRPLRPIDDRPVSVLAAIGGTSGGIGFGGDGPHCKPARPGMFTRSEVVSGAPSMLRSPRM